MIKLKAALLAFFGIIAFAGIAYAAPSFTYQPSLIPQLDSTYTLGTTSRAWLNIFTDNATVGTLSLTNPLGIANGGTATSTQVTNGVNFFDGTSITSGSSLIWASNVFSIRGASGVTGGGIKFTPSDNAGGGQPELSITGFSSGTAGISVSSGALRNFQIQNSSSGGLRTIFNGGTGASLVTIATSTGQWPLTIASSTGPQLALVDTTSSSSAWTLRSISNTLYIATSTATATSSVAALAINPNGITTFANDVGINTSVPLSRLHVKTNGTTSLDYALRLQNPNNTTGGVVATGIAFQTDTNVGTIAKGGIVYVDQNNYGRGDFYFLQNGNASVADASLSDVKAVLTNQGKFGVGTTTPFWQITAAHASLPQLALVDTTSSSSAWTLRSISNTFYLATSTATATSSVSALSIDPNGTVSLAKALPIASGGTATTTQVTNGVNFFDGTGITSGTALTFNGTNLGVGQPSPGTLLDIGDGTTASVVTYRGASGQPTLIATGFTSGIYAFTTGSSNNRLISWENTNVTARADMSMIDGRLGLADTSADFALEIATTTETASKGFFAVSSSANTDGDIFEINSGGLVGLSTTTPNWKLTIASSTGPQLALVDTTSSSTAWTFRSTANTLYIATSTATATSSTAALTVDKNGNLSVAKLVSCAGVQTSAAGLMSCTSDARLKDILHPFTTGLDAVRKIHPQAFKFKEGTPEYDGVTYNRFIAQDVQAAIPEAVNSGNGGWLQIDIQTIVAVVVNSIKDLANRQDDQQRQIDELRAEIAALKGAKNGPIIKQCIAI